MFDLIPFAPVHFARLLTWFASERDLVQWAGPTLAFPLDAAQLAAMLDEARGDPPVRLCWAARSGGVVMGHAQLAFDWRNGVARIGRIAIDPAWRGRGLATPMLAAVIDEAFRRPGIERAELNVYSFNTAALRTYGRAGLTVEGVRRSSVRVGDERWDTVMMAVLRAEHAGAGPSGAARA